MIAPLDSIRSPLENQVEAFFSTQGRLAQARNFEYRPQQQQMAEAVAKALSHQTHLLVEAGTGTGKSLAYLVPSLLHALEQNRKVVVSTHTINLQEQLFHKDMPLVHKVIPGDYQAVLWKGRRNYLCPRRLERAMRQAGELFVSSEVEELKRIWEWAQKTTDGTLSDFELAPDPKVWTQVCSEPHLCTAQTCGSNPRCFYQQSRKAVLGAHVVIMNHSLFFSWLGGEEETEAEETGYIFANDFVIFDEAHTLEQVAARHLGLGVSHPGLRQLLHRLYNPRTQKGLFQMLRKADAVRDVTEAENIADEFFAKVEKSIGNGREIRISRPDIVDNTLSLPLAKLHRTLADLAQNTEDKDLKAELQDAGRRIASARSQLAEFLSQEHEDYVYWIERGDRAGANVHLQAAPVEVGPHLKKILFRPNNTVVMTSATLSVGKGLGYFQNRIGGEDAAALQLDSPFDYAQQMKVYIPKTMPEPSQTTAYEAALAKWIKHFVGMTHGKAFVLFTSYKSMQNLARALETFFEAIGIRLLVQGEKLPRHRLLEKFKEDTDSVLFGTDSFWQGVDVPGEALSNVILTRLPFSVPDHPLTEARLERIELRGGDPFREYSLPEAILKFRQGVGRLIRTGQDKGIIVILDNRVLSKSYGKAFLQVLPQCPLEIID